MHTFNLCDFCPVSIGSVLSSRGGGLLIELRSVVDWTDFGLAPSKLCSVIDCCI